MRTGASLSLVIAASFFLGGCLLIDTPKIEKAALISPPSLEGRFLRLDPDNKSKTVPVKIEKVGEGRYRAHTEGGSETTSYSFAVLRNSITTYIFLLEKGWANPWCGLLTQSENGFVIYNLDSKEAKALPAIAERHGITIESAASGWIMKGEVSSKNIQSLFADPEFVRHVSITPVYVLQSL